MDADQEVRDADQGKVILHRGLKGGFKSEDTGEFLLRQNKCSNSLSWAENLNKLFNVLGGKLKFSA